MDDNRIIDLYFARDERAITATDAKYGAYCFAVANNVLGVREDSEECVSDTWLTAWNAIPPERPNVLRVFLARITRNHAFNRYKANRAGKRGGGSLPLVLDELADVVAGSDVESEVDASALREAVNRFLAELPARERGVFLRRCFYVEDVATVAKRYGMSCGAVQASLFRTRQKLRAFLEREEFI